MAKQANPAHRATRLQTWFTVLCRIVLIALPATGTAAIVPAPHATVSMQQTCDPCCHHTVPASVQPSCCTLQQDQAPATIAHAPVLTLEATPTLQLAKLDLVEAAAPAPTWQAIPHSPPPLIPLRI